MHTSYPPTDQPRERLLRLRVTDAEFAELERRASSDGRSVSAVVRSALFVRSAPREERASRRARARFPGSEPFLIDRPPADMEAVEP
jgi:hypothetical protein